MKWFVSILMLLILGVGAFLLQASPAAASPPAQTPSEGQQLFEQKCIGCHTIGGGKLVGPDLKDVTTRREAAWLKSFIADPAGVIASGDPIAVQILAENNNVTMPSMGLNDNEITALLAYLQAPGSAAAPPANPPAALPAGQETNGHKLFSGEVRLANGGTSCIACHTVQGAGLLAGGSLGPDLTNVMQRYGEAGLAANLNQIAFPTMQGPFLNKPLTPQEQADLVAFFRWSNIQPPAPAANLTTLMLGAGTAGGLILFGILGLLRPRSRQTLAERLHKNAARPTTGG